MKKKFKSPELININTQYQASADCSGNGSGDWSCQNNGTGATTACVGDGSGAAACSGTGVGTG